MAEEKKNTGLFHSQNEGMVQSPEKLREYIRIGSAGGYILITALVLVTVALIIWGFVGKLPVTITEYGVVGGDQSGTTTCVCFVDVDRYSGVIPEGNSVNVHMPDGTSFSGRVTYMSPYPQSTEELMKLYGKVGDVQIFSEWTLEHLLEDSTYSSMLIVETDKDMSAYWRQVVDVTIVVREVQPISLLVR